MKWKKLGLIFEPKTVNRDWMVTHAMDPTVDHVKDDIYRIYFCGRNKDNQSLIGFVEIDNLSTKSTRYKIKYLLGKLITYLLD